MARVCDTVKAWDLVATRVGSKFCRRRDRPQQFIVSNEVRPAGLVIAFGLPWHWSDTPFSRKVKNGGFHGSIWYTVAPLLVTDDAVRLRVVASR